MANPGYLSGMGNDLDIASPKWFKEVSGGCASRFSVGGVSVEVVGERVAAIDLVPSLVPFGTETSLSDINVWVEWVAGLSPMRGRLLFDSGSTWRLYEGIGSEFQFDFITPVFGDQPYKRLTADATFRRATLKMNEDCFAGAYYNAAPLDYPLDELLIMHRLTQEKAIELHGTGIVCSNGVANLFVGHSGAGKSTTTRLWTDIEDVEVLSDDRIIVRRDEDVATADGRTDGSGKNVGILRLHERSASPITHSAQNDKKYKMRMYGTPWHGEAMFASPNSAPLTRIFVLEHGHGNVITRLSPSQAVAELFARSFVPFHRHEYVDSALVFLEELVDSVPVYRYSFEPDQRAVDKIRHFND